MENPHLQYKIVQSDDTYLSDIYGSRLLLVYILIKKTELLALLVDRVYLFDKWIRWTIENVTVNAFLLILLKIHFRNDLTVEVEYKKWSFEQKKNY